MSNLEYSIQIGSSFTEWVNFEKVLISSFMSEESYIATFQSEVARKNFLLKFFRQRFETGISGDSGDFFIIKLNTSGLVIGGGCLAYGAPGHCSCDMNMYWEKLDMFKRRLFLNDKLINEAMKAVASENRLDIWVLSMVAISPEYQGKGIGKKAIIQGIHQIATREINKRNMKHPPVIYAVMWGESRKFLVEKIGLFPVGRVRYYLHGFGLISHYIGVVSFEKRNETVIEYTRKIFGYYV